MLKKTRRILASLAYWLLCALGYVAIEADAQHILVKWQEWFLGYQSVVVVILAFAVVILLVAKNFFLDQTPEECLEFLKDADEALTPGKMMAQGAFFGATLLFGGYLGLHGYWILAGLIGISVGLSSITLFLYFNKVKLVRALMRKKFERDFIRRAVQELELSKSWPVECSTER